MDCGLADGYLREQAGGLCLLPDNESSLSQTTRSPEHPYWGTLQSPSASRRTSRASRIVDNRTTDMPSNEPINDTTRQARKTPKREKRFGVADPLAWDVINRSLTQQHRLSSLVGADNPVAVPPKESSNKAINVVSRTSSQRRALSQFARELEKYADVAGAVGKAPVITPPVSDSKVSIRTVKPLVPYKDEFLAAGLAVTSTEQSRNLTSKAHAQGSLQRNRSHKQPNWPIQTRKKLDTLGDGTSPSASISRSCTSSGSYVEFSPPKNIYFPGSSRSRLAKMAAVLGVPSRFESSTLKEGKLNPTTSHPSSMSAVGFNIGATDQRCRVYLRFNYGPSLLFLQNSSPPKKEPCVALTADYCEQRDQGPHPEQEGGHYGSVIGDKQSLGGAGLRGKRDITRGVLPKPYPEFVGTIEEETNRNTHLVRNNNQDRYPPRIDYKVMPSVKQGPRQRPDVKSSASHESSIPSLPFAARLAANTASSLQRALDDACRKLDDENIQTDKLSKQKNIKQDLPPIPRQDSQENVPCRALPRKPRSAEKFIFVERTMPRVEVPQSTSKPLPPEPVSAPPATPEKGSGSRHGQPSDKPPPVSRALTSKRKKNAVAELAKAEEMLKDLDVFLNDYDDAGIEDRDVIKGLQVAIHAAADDLYDGYIRHKTGLRIRRFLADLKSFEDISELGSTDQRAREKRAKSRRLEGVGHGNNRHA
ncbi:hypothetical protein CIB48_g3041 [Xylaria polymorpha]|nr:hypothetical protein CIB48_g3041 [Xylaria polymorpha]